MPSTYYWLGYTAGGNVNIAGNWTIWGPNSGATLIRPSLNIPKFNDSVVFSDLKIAGVTYPLYSPSGKLTGLCGPSWNPTFQYLQSVTVTPFFPVSIGAGACGAFGIATKNMLIQKGVTSPIPSGSNSSYINFIDAGPTYLNAIARLDSKNPHNYWISGTLRRFESYDNALNSDESAFATIYLADASLTGLTGTTSVNSGNLNAGIYSQLSIINQQNTLTYTPQVTYNLYPSTYVPEAYFAGREYVKIFKGFNCDLLSLSSTPIVLGSLWYNSSYSFAYVNFIPEDTSGLTGPSEISRTYIQKLNVLGPEYAYMDTQAPKRPLVEFNHGADVIELNQHRCGTINFNQDFTADATVVSRGYYTPPSYSPTLLDTTAIISKTNSMSLGVNGTFNYSNVPINNDNLGLRFKLPGDWSFKIDPL